MHSSLFFPYSWNIDLEEKDITIIRIYGLNKENENVCVIINDFTPYIQLELPNSVDWESCIQMLSSKLDTMMGDKKPLLKKLTFKKKLFYADLNSRLERNENPYLTCYFSHTDDIRNLSYKLNKPISINGIGVINLKMHEQNANPILQMTCQRNISTAGWISFSGKKVKKSEKITHCHHEYIVSYKKLNPFECNTVVRPYIMGYDIEANSSIPSSMPSALRSQDKIFQISCVFARQGSKTETHESYLLTLGNPDHEKLGKEIILKTFKTESELLLGFTELIQEKQPNIIVGYNIFTFDIPYMTDRAKILYCISDFDQQGFLKEGHAREKSISWSSSAYKNQNFTFLDAEGRLFVDLLPLVKRDYKLNNYQLKTVASHFLKNLTKDPLDHKGIFKCYRLGMQGGIKGARALSLVGKYCVKDSLLVIRLFEILTTWIGLCEMSNVTGVPIFALYTQGQQIKVFSQVYRKCTNENIVVEKDGYLVKDDDHYVGATVFLPVPGVYDKVLPFDFASLYPSAIIAYNMCWSTLVNDDNIPDTKCHIMKWEDHIGCCHDPKIVRKTQLIEILKKKDTELKELRKSRDLKKNKNIKEDIIIKINEIVKQKKPFQEEKKQIMKSKPKYIICAKRNYRWLKEPMGVLPEILRDLLAARSKTKKEMVKVKNILASIKETDEKYQETNTYLDVLDQRQLALKISANSGYGITGAIKGYLTCMPVAMCTTYMGRISIEKAAESIKNDHQGIIVYGDTDSNYVSFNHLKTAKECWEHAEKVAIEVSKLFPPPMSLAFENKLYWLFMILSKKRYMSLGSNKDGKLEDKISKKGVLLQRRDNCPYVRIVYEGVVMMIFNKKELDDILYYVIEQFNKLCCYFYKKENFVITKSVGEIGEMIPITGVDDKDKICYKIGDYKVKLLPKNKEERDKQFKLKDCNTEEEYYLRSLPAQAQLAQKMRSRGQLVSAGSRLEYIITSTGGHLAKQYVKVEDYDYFSRHSETISIDYLYYLKQLVNPLDQVLDVIFEGKKNGNYNFQKGFCMQQYKFRYHRTKLMKQLTDLFKPKVKFV